MLSIKKFTKVCMCEYVSADTSEVEVDVDVYSTLRMHYHFPIPHLLMFTGVLGIYMHRCSLKYSLLPVRCGSH